MTEKKRCFWRENELLVRVEKKSGNKNIFSENNKTFVSGVIEKEPKFIYKGRWDNFFETRIKVERISGVIDLVPIVIPEKMIKKTMQRKLKGKWIEAAGEFSSYQDIGEDGLKHLKLFLYAKKIKIYDSISQMEEFPNTNVIYLHGVVATVPLFKRAMISGKDITEFRIVVKRPSNLKDFIPCVTWGKTAKWARWLEPGQEVKLYGRIQRRWYFKDTKNIGSRNDNLNEVFEKLKFKETNDIFIPENGKIREAYEVSIITLSTQ